MQEDCKRGKRKVEIGFPEVEERYSKTYENENEENFRMQVYINNSIYINEHNERYAKGQVSFELGMNHFGDLLPHEFKQRMLINFKSKGSISGKPVCASIILNSTTDLSKEWDWRDTKVVSPVKNQKGCQSCWAFAAVAALESHHYMKTKERVFLSEQNLVDCDNKSDGCKGGWADEAFRYVINNGGIATENNYPFEETDGLCRYKSELSSSVKVSDCRNLQPKDEQQLKIAIETVGPVTVAMYATNSFFRFYKSGVYYNKNCDRRPKGLLNHEALAVGFGTSDKGEDYWLVKNSWGYYWGDKGYFKIARNRKSHCGIADDSNYPIVEDYNE
ncbi:hypothetical protein V9T40_006058 [Parthenolecanium corni]|uniref:Cathepsin L n=1 Tax=Parthenolecanium corni TaxID=536013 RepID=A0AAN9TW37_9HEMI